MTLNEQFDSFFSSIQLTATQRERIESAVQSLRNYLGAFFDLDENGVFVQGSYATDSAVKPSPSDENGEYDVDIVVVCSGPDDEPQGAKGKVVEALEFHGTYAGKIEPTPSSKPCVKLRYAEDSSKFHVDIVPAKPGEVAPLESPRGENWKETAPLEFVAWCARQGESFRRTVMMLKRWRDEQQEAHRSIKSILFQVLIAQHLSPSLNDATRLVETLESMDEALDALEDPPEVLNPSLITEDLAANWTKVSFRDFKRVLRDAAEVAREALESQSDSDSNERWQGLLGSSFPNLPSQEPPAEVVQTRLASTTHVENPKWPMNLSAHVRLSAKVKYNRTKPVRMRRSINKRETIIRHERAIRSGTLLPKAAELFFKPSTDVQPPYEVWWQVANTGREAEFDNALRGNIFQNNQDLPNATRREETK
jgi:predicted nucleotidyltransferase